MKLLNNKSSNITKKKNKVKASRGYLVPENTKKKLIFFCKKY